MTDIAETCASLLYQNVASLKLRDHKSMLYVSGCNEVMLPNKLGSVKFLFSTNLLRFLYITPLSLTATLIKPCELKNIIYPPLSSVSGNRINFPSKTDT